MMRAITPAEALKLTAQSLGFDLAATDVRQLLKPALRRAVHILAPVAAGDLMRFVAEPLAPSVDLRSALEAELDELIIYGDILEMRRQEHDSWSAPAIVLRPAPPSFVHRANGDVIVLGVAGDHPSPLSQTLGEQLVNDGPVRRLKSDVENLPTMLQLLGLVQLSEQAWLRTPQSESAASHVVAWRERLESTSRLDQPIVDLEILDGARNPNYYPGRWCAAKGHSGIFVGRRPQLYGARLWSLVVLDAGRPTRLLDLYSGDDRQRPCDLAWRIQAALDCEGGTPQLARVRRGSDSALIDLFSPLPSFAERRLALVGRKIAGEKCLYSYVLPKAQLAGEIDALRGMLWLAIDEVSA